MKATQWQKEVNPMNQKDMYHVNQKDLVILSHLRENGREKLTTISKKTGLPVSTIFERLEKYKHFTKHTTMIEFSQIGFTARITLLIKTIKNDREQLLKHLNNHPNINTIAKITNDYDYLIEGIFKTMNDVEEFLERLEEKYTIKKKELYYILEHYKQEQFLSNPNMIQLVQ